jgi:hypothetical protein
MFRSWNEDVEERVDENKDEEVELRHGTTCIGVISRKHNKTVTEW